MSIQQVDPGMVAYQVLDVEGNLVGEMPDLSAERLLALYRAMHLGRAFSNKIIALQRQGRATTFAPLVGQEATAVGLAAPLQAQDWLATSYREIASLLVKGVPLSTLVYSFRGFLPAYPQETHCLPIQIVIGTQMLHAVGLAMAAKIAGDSAVSVGVCGDGATSEGDFNEALNFAGVFQAPVVLVVQNNGWAISVPRSRQTAAPTFAVRGIGFGIPSVLVDGNDVLAVYSVMQQAIERARTKQGPTLVEALTYRIGPHTTADDATRYRDATELEAWRAKDPLVRFRLFLQQRTILDEEYDRQLITAIEAEINAAVAEAEALSPPTPDEFFDYMSADLSPRLQEQRADLLRYSKQQGEELVDMQMTMIEALNRELALELERDSRVVLLGQDIGVNGGVFRVTERLQQRFGATRVFDTPLSESGIIGTSIGMAIYGLHPIAEIQFAGFLLVAINQLVSQAARMRFRSMGMYTCPLVVRAPYGGGVRTPELHSDSLEGIFMQTPGIKVVIPSNPYDAKGLLASAIADPDPVLFLEHIKLYRSFRQETPEDYYTLPLGKAKTVQEGSDVSLFAYGAMVQVALAAAKQLQDISIEVIDLCTIWPLDEEAIVASVEKTGRVVIVHEAARAGGVGAEITSVINDHCLYSLLKPVMRVTGYDTPYPPPGYEDDYVPKPTRVVDAIKRVMEP